LILSHSPAPTAPWSDHLLIRVGSRQTLLSFRAIKFGNITAAASRALHLAPLHVTRRDPFEELSSAAFLPLGATLLEIVLLQRVASNKVLIRAELFASHRDHCANKVQQLDWSVAW